MGIALQGFDRLTGRLEVQATLVMETGLHLGSGEEAGGIDAGVVRDRSGQPYIPGSSLKGVLRSESERIAHALGLTACGLFADSGIPCLTTDKAGADEYRNRVRRQGVDLTFLGDRLCDACKLFGSPFAASRVFVDDLPFAGEVAPVIERRDGVGIDRDTGTAAEHIKYDFQVVPSGATFRLRLYAENLDASGRALIAYAILAMALGQFSIGGLSSRGLGRCRLDDLQVSNARVGGADDLLALLTGSVPVHRDEAARTFLRDCVKEAKNA